MKHDQTQTLNNLIMVSKLYKEMGTKKIVVNYKDFENESKQKDS